MVRIGLQRIFVQVKPHADALRRELSAGRGGGLPEIGSANRTKYGMSEPLHGSVAAGNGAPDRDPSAKLEGEMTEDRKVSEMEDLQELHELVLDAVAGAAYPDFDPNN